jgi:branched-chain amino acid transport system substrate-binding protein
MNRANIVGRTKMAGSSRRRVLTGAALAGASILGLPGLLKAQSDRIRIGHLTPLTGFLGAQGEHGVLGIRMAEEEINAAGGVLGRPIEVISEDSVNPTTAAYKAQRMIGRDRAAVLLGETNSTSALVVARTAARNRKLFMSTGARSDSLREESCNHYLFTVDIPTTMMVNAIGLSLLRDNMVKGKKFFSLTADYLFGHDMLRVAKTFFDAHEGMLIGDEQVATDVTDFSPYLLKIRDAKPDVVCSNLAGNQIALLFKQYAEFGLRYPIIGFNLNTVDAWAAGEGNLSGTWPTVWHHNLDTPASKAFVTAFRGKHGKPPENHAWIEYIALKIMAQAMNETKSTDTEKLIGYLEKETQFDILKARKGYFRAWDHQMMQEAYPFSVKPPGQAKDRWDFLKLGTAVPGPYEPLEILATPKSQNKCRLT